MSNYWLLYYNNDDREFQISIFYTVISPVNQ